MKIRVGLALLGASLGSLFAATNAVGQCNGCPQASFAAPRLFGIPIEVRAVVSADFNNDGRPDVATIGGYPITLSVLLASPDAVLSSPVTSQITSDFFQSYNIGAGDFDGDGYQDLVITSGGNTIYFMRGAGDGTFLGAQSFLTTKTNAQLVVGDFNGDGNLDVAALDDPYGNSNNVNIYYGNGRGGFAPAITIPVGPSANELHAEDLNGDGPAELIAVNGSSNTISVITGVVVGPVAPARNIAVGAGPSGLAIGDWNGDGILDIAVANAEHGLTILLGAGGLNFASPTYSPFSGFRGRLLTGDFDGDGKQDLVAMDDWLKLLSGDGFGAFSPPRIVGATTSWMVVADVDLDGASDIVAASPNSVALLTNLKRDSAVFAGVLAFRFGSGDFNGDGKIDVVAFGSGGASILMSGPDGFSTIPLPMVAGEWGAGIVGDVNSDGKPDLLVISNNRLAVHVGGGGATFQAPTYYGLGNDARWISAGDLNQDGKLDVIATSYSGNSISVLLGHGDGTFEPRAEFAVGSRPTSIALADFNRDGKLDVAVGTEGGTIAVLLGNGNGGFSSIASFASGGNVRELIAVDFDQDGKSGVAFINSSSSGVTVMRGDGAGQLTPPTVIAASFFASAITSLDFDRDGRTDIVVGTFASGLICVRSLGGGAFADSTRYLAGTQALALGTGDLDGDGSTDLLVGNGGFGPSGIALLRNTNCLPRRLSVTTDISVCQVPGAPFSPEPVLHLLDDGSNRVTCDNGPVTASLLSGTGTAGAVLAGTVSVSSAGGIASYTNLSVDLPGAGYRVEFSHPQGARARTRTFSQGLRVAVAGPSVVCGTSASWSAGALFDTYQWTLDGAVVTRGKRLVRSGLAMGSHTLSLTVTKDGCTATDNHPFTVSSSVSGVVTSPQTVRAKSTGNTASVPDAGPGATYAWTISRGTITAGQGTRTVTFTAGTVGSVVLSVTVTASGGCSAPGAASTVIVAADFNANGQTDLLWRNSSTGENVVWLMNGLAVFSLSAPPSVFDLNWRIGGTADFDGDGQPDILWRNTFDGRNVVWLMNGSSVVGQAPLPAVTDQNWQMAGVADFDADGKPDILWRNGATGENVVWLMNGTAVASLAVVPTVPDLNWKIGGTGDLDGDGKPDILWRNYATGQDTIWLMNGTAIASQAPLPAVSDLSWQIVAVADLDGDGKADLIWRHANTGANTVWRMNRTVVSSTAPLPTVSDFAWKLSGPR